MSEDVGLHVACEMKRWHMTIQMEERYYNYHLRENHKHFSQQMAFVCCSLIKGLVVHLYKLIAPSRHSRPNASFFSTILSLWSQNREVNRSSDLE